MKLINWNFTNFLGQIFNFFKFSISRKKCTNFLIPAWMRKLVHFFRENEMKMKIWIFFVKFQSFSRVFFSKFQFHEKNVLISSSFKRGWGHHHSNHHKIRHKYITIITITLTITKNHPWFQITAVLVTTVITNTVISRKITSSTIVIPPLPV